MILSALTQTVPEFWWKSREREKQRRAERGHEHPRWWEQHVRGSPCGKAQGMREELRGHHSGSSERQGRGVTRMETGAHARPVFTVRRKSRSTRLVQVTNILVKKHRRVHRTIPDVYHVLPDPCSHLLCQQPTHLRYQMTKLTQS